MIVSETPNRVSSRWLQACVLLCAMVVLPLGVVYAQDYEAVGRRLRAAVEAGELTGEQARAMLGTLRKAGGAKKDQEPHRAREYLMKVRKELGAAVEAGKINKEDAVKRYEGAEKAIKARMARARGERSITVEEYKRAEAKMRKMVEDGKAKPEDVERRLIEMRKMMGERGEGDGRKADRERFAGIRERIEGAVKAGKMTREEADAKYKEIREGMAKRRQR